jgi:branched-chain amino acid transport system permease protein
MVFCGFLGLFMGVSCLKVRGVYLALVTLGFGMILERLCMNLTGLTGGGLGIIDIPHLAFGQLKFSSEASIFFLFVVIVYLVIYLSFNIRNSRMGRAFVTIRENEVAAATMGVNISKYKVIAFLISGVFGGLAGGLFAHLKGYIDPSVFSIETSLLIFCMVIIGGMGSLPGAVIGAVLLSFLPEIVRPLAEYRMLIYGILLIILIIFMPKGIISLIRKIPRFKIFWFLLGSAEKNVDKHNTVAP